MEQMLHNESKFVKKKNKMVYQIEYNTVGQSIGDPNVDVRIRTVDLEPRVTKALVRKGVISLWRQ